MLDNIDVAILTKLNDLAHRHGIKPYDFVATVSNTTEAATAAPVTKLSFETVTHEVAHQPHFDKMLEDLCVDEEGVLKGANKDIFEALDRAIRKAPARSLGL